MKSPAARGGAPRARLVRPRRRWGFREPELARPGAVFVDQVLNPVAGDACEWIGVVHGAALVALQRFVRDPVEIDVGLGAGVVGLALGGERLLGARAAALDVPE